MAIFLHRTLIFFACGAILYYFFLLRKKNLVPYVPDGTCLLKEKYKVNVGAVCLVANFAACCDPTS